MGGKGSGLKPKFNDEYHRVARELQRAYDRQIREIRRQNKCSWKEAQQILKERNRKRKEEKLKGKK